MIDAIFQSISCTLILVLVAGFGWTMSHKALLDANGAKLVSKIVNLSIPFFLFHSVTSKFTHDQLLELLQMAFLPFVTLGINLLVSFLFVRLGLVRKELKGIFVACFTSSTVLFVGVPVTTALFGEAGIPYLLVYFFANCLFIWTVALYNIQLDGAERGVGVRPKLVSAQSARMLLSPQLMSFAAAIACILLSVPIPHFVAGTVKTIGQITSPLALIFIGMTIERVGFEKLKHLPREIWLVLFSCFVLRPVVMYFATMPFDMDPLMRKVFVCASALPVSSVVAVLAKNFGADEEFASETIGATTIGLAFALPVILLAVSLM